MTTALANRQKLIAALRAEQPFPNFTWDFSTILNSDEGCGSIGCALGLATLIFSEALTDNPDSNDLIDVEGDEDEVMEFFGIEDHATFLNIFYRASYYNMWDPTSVTPQMVADALEALDA